jgi:hypothetical protein
VHRQREGRGGRERAERWRTEVAERRLADAGAEQPDAHLRREAEPIRRAALVEAAAHEASGEKVGGGPTIRIAISMVYATVSARSST